MASPTTSALARATDKALLLDNQRRVLERIASGGTLVDTLELLVRLIENQAGDMPCAVLLADAGGQRLRFVAARGVPAQFIAAMEPNLGVGPDTSPCGRAAFLRQPVYVYDIATDLAWPRSRDLALQYGLRAVWSTPIISDDSVVLGTFVMYYREPRLPSSEHVQVIEMATQLARVAIEAKADDEILRAVFDNGSRGIVITDETGRIVRANHAFASRLGYSAGELRGTALREISEDSAGPGLMKALLGADEELVQERGYRTRSGAILRVRERVALRRGPHGDPSYVLIRVTHLGDAGGDPLGTLSPRERQVLELVVAGRSSKKIAAALVISTGSVDTYRSRVMQKLGVEDLAGLVRFAIRHGVVSA
jgi:PAS domain S-box-containing protein